MENIYYKYKLSIIPIECIINLCLLLKGYRKIIQYDKFLYTSKIWSKINKMLRDDLIKNILTIREDEKGNLIIYKKALFNSSFESENNLIEMLSPIINSESIWKSHGLYLMGEYFYSKNENQKSKDFFDQILILENANPKIKIETKKKLNRDFSE